MTFKSRQGIDVPRGGVTPDASAATREADQHFTSELLLLRHDRMVTIQ